MTAMPGNLSHCAPLRADASANLLPARPKLVSEVTP